MSSVLEDHSKMKPPPSSAPISAENMMNLALLDPPRWGWTAGGGVADVLPPHERSRRRSTAVAYKKERRRRLNALSENQNAATTGLSVSKNPAENDNADCLDYSSQNTGSRIRSASLEGGTGSVVEVGESSDLHQDNSSASALPTGPAASALPTTDGTLSASSRSLHDNTLENSKKPHWKTLQKMNRMNGLLPNLPPGYCSKFGIEKQFLGMSISKGKGNEEVSPDTLKGGEKLECVVESVKDGVLDMYSYHRGREGMEPRDPESGELLCHQEVTDTNHEWDAPKMIASVVVEFPLSDDEAKEDAEKPKYQEIIDWDLSDPTTKSPVDFASDIAKDFGLTFGQMMDVAISIQQQIDVFVHQHFTYSAPLAYKDPNENERRFVGPTLHTQKYGHVLSAIQGGIRLAKKEAPSRQRAPASVTTTKSHPTTAGPSAGSSNRRKSVDRVTEVVSNEPLEEVEDDLREEVLERARSASVIDIRTKCAGDTVVGKLEKRHDFHCHICHKKCKVTYNFACGVNSHAYCEMHCRTRFSIGEDPSVGFAFAYCPICSLACTCSKCRRKVDNVTRDFKKACAAQGTDPKDTKFDDILDRCDKAPHLIKNYVEVRKKVEQPAPVPKPAPKPAPVVVVAAPPKPAPPPKPEPEPKTTPKARKSAARGDGRKHAMVPKPPLTDFPREVCGLIELEPGTPNDYLKVYTSKGTYVVEDFPESWKESTKPNRSEDSTPPNAVELQEDGNVDFCNVCQQHGILQCCDSCPRAFHSYCIEEKVRQKYWECPVCREEKRGLAIDTVDGKKSIDLISGTFLNIDPADEAARKCAETLGKIHEMLVKLMDYDFGYIFAKPVGDVEGYKDIVKNPMDLGTICSKLINGNYVSMLETGKSFDDVILAVLKDIELVWHNCYCFNFEGSAVYRMATVVSRRAQMICKKSFEGELSDDVKRGVSEYIASCEIERGRTPRPLSTNIFPTEEEKVLQLKKPRGKHKITVKVNKVGSNRPVAVIDSALGRVVKIYSTIKTAGQAVQSIASLGHRCEWILTSDIKPLVQKSATDPSVLIFGYRWVMLDSLRAGKVMFPETPSDVIEMKHGDCTFIFMSIEEALSSSNLPKKTRISDLREKLQSLSNDSEWSEFYGCKWRRPEKLQLESSGGIISTAPNNPANSNASASDEAELLEHSKIVKEDLISGRKLIGFGTIEAAFQDWVHSITLSPSFPKDEPKSMEHFKEFYLNGDRNVDGLHWMGQVPGMNCRTSSTEVVDQSKVDGPDGDYKNNFGRMDLTQANNRMQGINGAEGEQAGSSQHNIQTTNSTTIQMSADISVSLGKRKRPEDDHFPNDGISKGKIHRSFSGKSIGDESSEFSIQAAAVSLMER